MDVTNKNQEKIYLKGFNIGRPRCIDRNVCIYIYIQLYIHMYIYIYMHISYIYIYICIYPFIYIYVCVLYMYICVCHVYTYIKREEMAATETRATTAPLSVVFRVLDLGFRV